MESDLTSPPQNKLRVLVIDDEKNIRATLSLCLEQIGCQVSGAASAESALALPAQEHTPSHPPESLVLGLV